MKAAIYCRVSTTEQTTENQELAIERFCELQNIKITKIYTDTISGSKQDRTGLIAGLDRAKANKVKLGRPRKGFDVAAALELRNKGKGFGEIAQILGECKSTVYRGLKSVSKTPSENV